MLSDLYDAALRQPVLSDKQPLQVLKLGGNHQRGFISDSIVAYVIVGDY